MSLMELYAVPDVFATAMGRMDILSGGLGRFVFYVERQVTPDAPKECIIVASIVMPLETLQANRALVDRALANARSTKQEVVSLACMH